MTDDHFLNAKQRVLAHVQGIFSEIEQELAVSHQEKYALLEDAFENATDPGELRVAFAQWYSDHADDVGFEHEEHELWDHALTKDEDEDEEYDGASFTGEDEDDEDDEEEDE